MNVILDTIFYGAAGLIILALLLGGQAVLDKILLKYGYGKERYRRLP